MNDNKEILVYITAISPYGNTGQNTFEMQFISQFLANSKFEAYDYCAFYPVNKMKINYVRSFDNEYQFIQKGKSTLNYLFAQFHFFITFFIFLFKNRRKNIKLLIRYHETMISPLILSFLFRYSMVLRTGPILPNLFIYKKNPSKLLYSFIKFSLGLYYKRSKNIITVTKTIKDWVIKTYNIDESKIVIIPNGVNTNFFFPELANKKRTNLNGKLTLGYVGYIYEDSGLDTILDAFASLLKKKFSLPKLVIVGGGDYVKVLKLKAKNTGISKYIEWIGSVNQKNVPKYIYKCDIMLAPFPKRVFEITGSSSLKLFEYLACNKPILASHAEDHLFIEENNLGILVEPENTVLWTKEIESLTKTVNKLPQKGFEYVKKNHSHTKQVDNYISVLINK